MIKNNSNICMYFTHQMSLVWMHHYPFVILKSCEDELCTGLSSVVLEDLTSDPLLLMLHQDECCIPCRSQKTNDWPVQSFSRAAINLHFLFRAKGIGHWLENMCYRLCLPRRSSGSPDSTLPVFFHHRQALHMYVYAHKIHTQILLPPSLVSQPVCWVRLWIWPLAYMCVRISAKADPVLTALSVSLWNWPFILVLSLFFCQERWSVQSTESLAHWKMLLQDFARTKVCFCLGISSTCFWSIG